MTLLLRMCSTQKVGAPIDQLLFTNPRPPKVTKAHRIHLRVLLWVPFCIWHISWNILGPNEGPMGKPLEFRIPWDRISWGRFAAS